MFASRYIPLCTKCECCGAERVVASGGGHDDCAACPATTTAVAMGHGGVEIHRVSASQCVFFLGDAHAERALQHVDEFDTGVMVHADFFERHGQEICDVRVEPAFGCRV